jgi:hypothetical protein
MVTLFAMERYAFDLYRRSEVSNKDVPLTPIRTSSGATGNFGLPKNVISPISYRRQRDTMQDVHPMASKPRTSQWHQDSPSLS